MALTVVLYTLFTLLCLASTKSATSRQGPVHQISVNYHNTPITPTSFQSPVIAIQTALGRDKANFPNSLYTCFVIVHHVLSAPVYNNYFSIYGAFLVIPRQRALRIQVEEQALLKARSQRKCTSCLKKGQSTPRSIPNRHEVEQLLNVTALLTYEDGVVQRLVSPSNITLQEKPAGQSVKVEIFAHHLGEFGHYKDCTVVYARVNATMVNMFDVNPYVTAGVTAMQQNTAIVVPLSILLMSMYL